MKNPSISTKFISALIILSFICTGNVYPLDNKNTLRKPLGDAAERAQSILPKTRTMAIGSEGITDYATELKALILEDLMSVLNDEEKRKLVQGGDVSQNTKTKMLERLNQLQCAIENELFHRLLCVLTDAKKIRQPGYISLSSKPEDFSGYADIFEKRSLASRYRDQRSGRSIGAALVTSLVADNRPLPEKIRNGRAFKGLISEIAKEALSDQGFLDRMWRSLGGALTDTRVTFSYSRSILGSIIKMVTEALKQPGIQQFADTQHLQGGATIDELMSDMRGNLFYEIPLLVVDFNSQEEGMRNKIKEWAFNAGKPEEGFNQINFIDTTHLNRREYLSVNFEEKWRAGQGNLWEPVKGQLNVMEHFVHYLTCLEILYPGKAEEIFKSFLLVEQVRVKIGEEFINRLMKPGDNRPALSEDEAFDKVRQASFIGLVSGSGESRIMNALAQSIWFIEVFAHPGRGIRKQISKEELQTIVKEFLYGREGDKGMMPYISDKDSILEDLTSRVEQFGSDVGKKLTAKVNELMGPPRKRTMAIGDFSSRGTIAINRPAMPVVTGL